MHTCFVMYSHGCMCCSWCGCAHNSAHATSYLGARSLLTSPDSCHNMIWCAAPQEHAIDAVCSGVVAHVVDRVVLLSQIEDMQAQLDEIMYGFEDEQAANGVVLLQVGADAASAKLAVCPLRPGQWHSHQTADCILIAGSQLYMLLPAPHARMPSALLQLLGGAWPSTHGVRR